MTIEEAIRSQYGVKIPATPPDLKLRKFKIDQLRNGFLMKGVDCGVFGSFIDGEAFIFNELGITFIKLEHKDHKEIRAEWLIWEIARSVLERGEKLDVIDSERLALAVQRLEEWL
jgi:hypothetical protein